jgi:hypothetical protein
VSISLNITVDPATIANVEAQVGDIPNGMPKVIAAAANDAAQRGKTILSRGLAATITAKQVDIKKRLRVPRGTKATPARPGTVLEVTDTRLSLIRFKTKDTKRQGVTAEMFRGEVTRFPEAFMGVGLFKNPHVIQRKGGKVRIKQAHYKPNLGKLRQNVVTQPGLSLPDVYARRPALLQDGITQIAEVFVDRIDSQLDRLLHRRKADRP